MYLIYIYLFTVFQLLYLFTVHGDALEAALGFKGPVAPPRARAPWPFAVRPAWDGRLSQNACELLSKAPLHGLTHREHGLEAMPPQRRRALDECARCRHRWRIDASCCCTGCFSGDRTVHNSMPWLPATSIVTISALTALTPACQ